MRKVADQSNNPRPMLASGVAGRSCPVGATRALAARGPAHVAQPAEAFAELSVNVGRGTHGSGRNGACLREPPRRPDFKLYGQVEAAARQPDNAKCASAQQVQNVSAIKRGKPPLSGSNPMFPPRHSHSRQIPDQACNDNGLFRIARERRAFGCIIEVAKVTGPISVTLIADHVLIIGPVTRPSDLAA